MANVNPKQITLTVGVILMLTGFAGLLGTDGSAVVPSTSRSSGTSTLEVKRGNNLPASTINLIQGSSSLQSQGSQPQSGNAGSQLQPNAGASSLPKNY